MGEIPCKLDADGGIRGGRGPSWTSFSRLNAPWLEAAVGRGGEALRACIVCTERLIQFDRWILVCGKRFSITVHEGSYRKTFLPEVRPLLIFVVLTNETIGF